MDTVIGDFNVLVDSLMRGSIDIHVHAAPDPTTPRRHDIVDLAIAARDAGMAGIVFKSHEYPTQPAAYVVERTIPGVRVFGSLSLDTEVGGLNPAAVEVSARIGARKVWMPTFTADHWSRNRLGRPGIRILDARGALLPVVHEILDVIAGTDMALGTGHLSLEEQQALVPEACRRGIRTVVTHADMWIPVEWQQEFARRGALIEHAYIVCLPQVGTHTPETIAGAVRAVGAERCIISTDLGQAHNPSPPEGLRVFIAHLLRAGLPPDDVATMVKRNPAQLLGLESETGRDERRADEQT